MNPLVILKENLKNNQKRIAACQAGTLGQTSCQSAAATVATGCRSSPYEPGSPAQGTACLPSPNLKVEKSGGRDFCCDLFGPAQEKALRSSSGQAAGPRQTRSRSLDQQMCLALEIPRPSKSGAGTQLKRYPSTSNPSKGLNPVPL